MCALEHIPLVSFFLFFLLKQKGNDKIKKKAICRLAEGLTVIWFIPHVVCKLTSPLTQRHAWTSHYKQDLFLLSSSVSMYCSHQAAGKGSRRRRAMLRPVRLLPLLARETYFTSLAGRRRSLHCACILFLPLHVWGEEKSKSEGPFEQASLIWVMRHVSLSLFIIVWCAMNHLFSLKVCQSSLFRVNRLGCFFVLPLRLSATPPLLTCFFFFFFMMSQIQTCNSRQDLRAALMGDGAHLLNMLPITASHSLSWLQN